MTPGTGSESSFALLPSSRRSWILAILCFLLAVPGAMAMWLENTPGKGDDVLYMFLSVPWIVGGIYLLRRTRRPVLLADRTRLTYVPYDDPVARLRYGTRIHVAWSDIRSIAPQLVGRPAVIPMMSIMTVDERHIELPLLALGVGFEELAARLQQVAGPVLLPVEA